MNTLFIKIRKRRQPKIERRVRIVVGGDENDRTRTGRLGENGQGKRRQPENERRVRIAVGGNKTVALEVGDLVRIGRRPAGESVAGRAS